MPTKFYKFFNVLAFFTTLFVNYLANALPINGVKTYEISNKYFNEFAPAGITFSIWGIIYSLILGLMVGQFFKSTPERDTAIRHLSPYFILNCLLNAAWLLSWHYDILGLSVLLMLPILWTLFRINVITTLALSPNQWLKAALGVYFGWICVATIANMTTWLVSLGWNGFGLSPTFWVGSLIAIGANIAAATTWRLRNMYIGAAFVWAFLGIIIRQNQLHGAFTPISWAAITWVMPIIVSMFYSKTFK